MDKNICVGVSAFGSLSSYLKFCGGRHNFPKTEFEQWVLSPFPKGLGLPHLLEPRELCPLLTDLCFPYEKKEFAFENGEYVERYKEKELETKGKDYFAATGMIHKFFEAMGVPTF
ncbi:hypothetical protein PMV_007 [Port-miou virus]|uniref:Uncharacterized protein n=1 Tax=Port-miou virus TaxID=1733873 RepID=A0A0N9PYN0_9VIRU|nr:hypothetical protein PMV_007 [Port-miou virus]